MGKYKKIGDCEFQLKEDGVTVSLEDIGEGYNGDYNPNDPQDRPLLRMDVYVNTKKVKNEYAEDGGGSMQDSSYCTCLISNDEKTARKALRYIMDKVKKPCLNGQSIKKICERLSWLSPSDFKT